MFPTAIRSEHAFAYGIVLDVPSELDKDLVLMRLRDFVEDQTLAARAARSLTDEASLDLQCDDLRDFARLVRSSAVPFSKDSWDKEHRQPLAVSSNSTTAGYIFSTTFEAALDKILGKGHELEAFSYYSETCGESLIVLQHCNSLTYFDDEETDGVEAFDLSSLPAIDKEQVNKDMCLVMRILNLKGTKDSPGWLLVAERNDWKHLCPRGKGRALYDIGGNGDLECFCGGQIFY